MVIETMIWVSHYNAVEGQAWHSSKSSWELFKSYAVNSVYLTYKNGKTKLLESVEGILMILVTVNEGFMLYKEAGFAL